MAATTAARWARRLPAASRSTAQVCSRVSRQFTDALLVVHSQSMEATDHGARARSRFVWLSKALAESFDCTVHTAFGHARHADAPVQQPGACKRRHRLLDRRTFHSVRTRVIEAQVSLLCRTEIATRRPAPQLVRTARDSRSSQRCFVAAVDGGWSDWDACSCQCGTGGTQTRSSCTCSAHPSLFLVAQPALILLPPTTALIALACPRNLATLRAATVRSCRL